MAVVRQMWNALGLSQMPILNNPMNRVFLAALLPGLGNFYQAYREAAPMFGELLPALGGGSLNAPVTFALGAAALELTGKVVQGAHSFYQNHKNSQTQGALAENVTQEISKFNSNLQDQVSLTHELNALGLRLTTLRNTLNGQRTEAQLVEDRAEFEKLKAVQEKILSASARIPALQQLPANPADPAIVLRTHLTTLITGQNQLNAANLQTTLEKLELLDKQLELRAKAQEKIDLLESVGVLDIQKERLAIIKSRQEAAALQIANLGNEIAPLEQQRTQLGVDLALIQGEEDGWFSGKAGRVAKKQAEITAKEAQINAKKNAIKGWRRGLLDLRGLRLADVNAEITRLQLLPQTDQIATQIANYQQIAAAYTQINLAPLSAEADVLIEQIRGMPFLQPAALQAQIDALNGELQELPHPVSLQRNAIINSLRLVREALSGVVDAQTFGTQRGAFETIQIPKPLKVPAQPAPAAAPAVAPAPTWYKTNAGRIGIGLASAALAATAAATAPIWATASALAVAAPVVAYDYSRGWPLGSRAVEFARSFFKKPAPVMVLQPQPDLQPLAQAPRPHIDFTGLKTLSNTPNLAPCALNVDVAAARFDIKVPAILRDNGGTCLAAVLQMFMKTPFLVSQVPLAINAKANEKALFGDNGAGGIGEKTQSENLQCSPEKLQALKEIAVLFRMPTLGEAQASTLRDLLGILEQGQGLKDIRGLSPENKQNIRQLLLLLELRHIVTRAPQTISEGDFGKLSRCMNLVHPKISKTKLVGPPGHQFYQLDAQLYSEQMFQALVELVAPKSEKVHQLKMGSIKDSHKIDKKYQVVYMSVPPDRVKGIHSTFTATMTTGEKATYRVVGMIETPQGKLEATAHALQEQPGTFGKKRSWYRYDAAGMSRVVSEQVKIEDGSPIQGFLEGNKSFIPSFKVAVLQD